MFGFDIGLIRIAKRRFSEKTTIILILLQLLTANSSARFTDNLKLHLFCWMICLLWTGNTFVSISRV